jgi:undecaprenyl-diphosphatase
VGAHDVGAPVTRRGGASLVSAPLLAVALLAAIAFGVVTFESAAHPYLPFDLPLTCAIQAVPWGPVVMAFGAVDWLEGVRQVVAAGAGLVLVLLVNRRAALLYVACALSGAAYSLTEVLVARPRPPAGLVHVARHTAGFGYPSGHVVFFTWFVTVLVLSVVRPRLPRAFTAAGWIVAAVLIALVGIGRVDVGEHWPSDVLGGLALGVGWTALALSVRPLSEPVLNRDRALHARPGPVVGGRGNANVRDRPAVPCEATEPIPVSTHARHGRSQGTTAHDA